MTTETPQQLALRVNVCPATVWRWIKAGVAVGTARVKLRAVKLGGRWSVSSEAWEAFVAACNPGAEPVPESLSKRDRRMRAERAALLKLLG